MKKKKLNEYETKQLFYVNKSGDLCRKRVDSFDGANARALTQWNNNCGTPIHYTYIAVFGRLTRRVAYFKDVVRFGMKKADEIVYKTHSENIRIGMKKAARESKKFHTVDLAKKEQGKRKRKLAIASVSVEAHDGIQKSEMERVDNSDLYGATVDYSASRFINCLSAYD